MTPLIVKRNYPPMPPYHRGLYMEEEAIRYFGDKRVGERRLVPVSWRECYHSKMQARVQKYLDDLPPGQWICVTKHDRAVEERLPEGTLVYSAGGRSGGIPVPYAASPLPVRGVGESDRDILASFIGAASTRMRGIMAEMYSDEPDFWIELTGRWTPAKSRKDFFEFKKLGLRSKFMLAPRGYGLSSYRLYEAFQLGAVPVYMTDNAVWLPFRNFVDWEEICVICERRSMSRLPEILRSMGDEERLEMVRKGREAWEKFFRFDRVMPTIARQILDIDGGLSMEEVMWPKGYEPKRFK